ncbi:MAG: flagellar biosynthetic protein FliQ [Gammaproteobacteria bacterium]|nr:MAG: flagellar biosynthetic protein FliQ [Gammaproteobacteria bacterium]
MTPETVIELAQQTLMIGIMLVAPLLLSALVIGVLIGMFQAATQINEQTLSFVPKIAAMAAALFIAAPWMLSVIIDFTRELISNIPNVIG